MSVCRQLGRNLGGLIGIDAEFPKKKSDCRHVGFKLIQIRSQVGFGKQV
jgi:hypothetical protein